MNFFLTTFQLCLGFTSYRRIRDLPLTASLKHLAALIFLLSIILIAAFLPEALRLINRATDWTQQYVPPFSIRNGAVVVPETTKQPYTAGNHDFLFLLDTTGKTTTPDSKALTGILVTSNSLTCWVKSPTASDATVYTKSRSLQDFPDTEITPAYIGHALQTFLIMTAFLIPILALLLVLFQAIFFAAASTLFERGIPDGLRWPQLFNIALHAVTPAAILVTIYLLIGLHDLPLQPIYLITYGVFLLGATNACRDRIEPEPMPDSDWS